MTKQEILNWLSCFVRPYTNEQAGRMIDIIKDEFSESMWKSLNKTCAIYVMDAMVVYADQETQSLLTQLEASAKIIRESGQIIIDQEQRIKKLEEVIRELVELKDLKDSNVAFDTNRLKEFADYMNRKPLAWAAARKSIAQQALKE